MQPETVSTETVYEGKVFDIRIDTIREGEVEYKREIVVHRGSTVVIPLFDDGTVALVRQYRHAAGKHLLEICAGTLEKGEDPETAAIRELEEEVGVRAAKLEKLTEFYISPGFLTEKMFVFLASDLTETTQNLEIDELLTIERYSIPAALDMIRSGEIEDAKTITGLMLAAERVKTGSGSELAPR